MSRQVLPRWLPVLLTVLVIAGHLVSVPAPLFAAPDEPRPAIRPLRTLGLPMELAALILSGQQGGPVPFEMLPLVTPMDDGQGRVIVVFDIDPLAFQLPTAHTTDSADTTDSPETATGGEAVCGGSRNVEIMMYAVTEGGAVRDSLLQTFEIDTDRLEPCLLDTGVRFVGQLELPPGDVSLRSLVRIDGEHVGLRVAPLRVGPGDVGADRAAWLSPPLLYGLADDRPVLYEVLGAGAPVTKPPPGLGGVPAADPVVRRDDTVQVKVLAVGLGRISSEWRAVIQDGGGKILGQVPVRLAYGPAEGEVRVLEMSFDTVGFPIGQMLLSLQSGSANAATGAEEETTERTPESLERPAWREDRRGSLTADLSRIRDAGDPGVSVATPTVRLTVVADRTATFSTDLIAPPPEDFDPTSAQARRAVSEATQTALPAIRDALDASEWGAARDGVMLLTTSIGGTYGREGLNQMGRVTLEMFAGPRLLPAAVLHHDLYREARRLGNFLVSTYAREVYVACAHVLEDEPDSPSGLAADLYALLGVELQTAGLIRFSTEMLRRAVELDPEQTVARLSLAINFEQLGLIEDAVGVYGKLLESQPGNNLAALRRALALHRIGRDRAAREALEELVTRAHEPWVLTVAYQQLAMERLRRDGPLAARDLLRRALRRLPREPRLYLQLAFVLDTLGQREAATAVLDDMNLRTTIGGGYTPRHRLTQWTSDATADLKHRLRLEADQRLAALRGDPS